MSFAFMMGISRLLYGRIGHRLDIKKALMFSGLLCLVCVLILALSPWPILGLIACAVCGFSVGILWPGAISLSVASIRLGGTTMFAFPCTRWAVGCTLGPTVVGTGDQRCRGQSDRGLPRCGNFSPLMIFGIIAVSHPREKASVRQQSIGFAKIRKFPFFHSGTAPLDYQKWSCSLCFQICMLFFYCIPVQLRYSGESARKILIRGDIVCHFSFVVGHVSRQIEIARAGQSEEYRLFLSAFLALQRLIDRYTDRMG